jgi:hypothetical protein
MGSLRALAESDLATTLEGDWQSPVLLASPDGLSKELLGQAGDVGATIDPDTGAVISGRTVHAALRISSIEAAGFKNLPEHVESLQGLPWLVTIRGLDGTDYPMAVRRSWPDRTLGIVTLSLEHWID